MRRTTALTIVASLLGLAPGDRILLRAGRTGRASRGPQTPAATAGIAVPDSGADHTGRPTLDGLPGIGASEHRPRNR